MKELLKPDFQKNKETYLELIRGNANKTAIAGRYAFDAGKEKYIVNDIINKLDLKEGQTLFDIGGGAGLVAELLIKKLFELGVSITLMDLAELIDVLKEELISANVLKDSKVEFIKGYFPDDFKQPQKKFDRILLYAVLMDVDDPFEIIDEGLKLLKPYGKLLLGDLPNISRKGRFLSSENGRIFDAAYKKTAVENLPVYKIIMIL